MLASLEQSRATERRFLADASHELRTPVTALLGNVDYAARHGADPEVLADLQRDAQRLARLVDDLLVLERSGGGGQESEPVELDGVVREVAARHPDGRVTVGPVVAAEVYGDRDALARSIENLIENGLVHGPDGGRVTVALGRRETVAVLTVSTKGQDPTRPTATGCSSASGAPLSPPSSPAPGWDCRSSSRSSSATAGRSPWTARRSRLNFRF